MILLNLLTQYPKTIKSYILLNTKKKSRNYIHFVCMDYENPEKIKIRFNINIDHIENLIQSLIALKNVIER